MFSLHRRQSIDGGGQTGVSAVGQFLLEPIVPPPDPPVLEIRSYVPHECHANRTIVGPKSGSLRMSFSTSLLNDAGTPRRHCSGRHASRRPARPRATPTPISPRESSARTSPASPTSSRRSHRLIAALGVVVRVRSDENLCRPVVIIGVDSRPRRRAPLARRFHRSEHRHRVHRHCVHRRRRRVRVPSMVDSSRRKVP